MVFVNYSCMQKMLPISIFIFFYMIVFSFHSRAVPHLIATKICQQRYNQTQTFCDNLKHEKTNQSIALNYHIQNEMLSWEWLMQLTSTVPSIMTVFFLGMVIGLLKNIRRIILFCTVILGVQCLVYFLVVFLKIAPIYYLLMGNSLTAVFGGFQGALLLAYVYVDSITKPDGYRTIKFVILEGISYCAIALGRFSADYIVYQFDYKGAFCITLAVCAGNFIFLLLIFPLTTDTDEIETFVRLDDATEESDDVVTYENTDNANHCNTDNGTTATTASCCQKLKSVLCSECLHGNMEYMAAIILSSFLFSLGDKGRHELMPNVVNWQNVGLSSSGTERYIFFLRLAQGLASVPLVVLLTKACCMATDVMVLFTSLSSYSLALVLIGFSKTTTILFCVSALAVCEPLAIATYVSVTTKEITPRAHGAAIGLLGSLNLGAMILVKFIVYTYQQRAHDAEKYQYLVFIVLAICTLMAFITIGVASLRYQKPLIEFEDQDAEIPKGELKPLLNNKSY